MNFFGSKIHAKIKLKNSLFSSDYEQVRDLPDFDFTERVSLLKKIHCDLSQPLINKGHCEPFRISSATSSRKKTSACKKKKRDSPLRRNTISSSLCRVSYYLRLAEQLFKCLP